MLKKTIAITSPKDFDYTDLYAPTHYDKKPPETPEGYFPPKKIFRQKTLLDDLRNSCIAKTDRYCKGHIALWFFRRKLAQTQEQFKEKYPCSGQKGGAVYNDGNYAAFEVTIKSVDAGYEGSSRSSCIISFKGNSDLEPQFKLIPYLVSGKARREPPSSQQAYVAYKRTY